MTSIQRLEFENIRLGPEERKGEALYFLSGKRLYEIADQSGDYPPLGWRRPGFLVGRRLVGEPEEERPVAAAHLLQEMGGVWAHPIKGIENMYFSIGMEDRSWMLKDCHEFIYHLSHADQLFEQDGIKVIRRDFAVEDQPALFALVRVKNEGPHSRNLRLNLTVTINIIPSWFAGWREGDDVVFYADGKMVSYDSYWTSKWGLVFGTSETPEGHQFGNFGRLKTCTLTYALGLNPGEERSFPFLFVIEHQQGYPKAIQLFDTLLADSERLLAEKTEYYHQRVFEGVRFSCSDKWFTDAFYLAKANFVMLTAEPSPYLGKYLFAGIPEYVQFFGCDSTYSIPGMLAAGYVDLARDTLLGLAKYAQDHCGRVPHEVTTNGRIFHPGNTQETPQFAIAVWEYFKWTGDRAFLEEVYPICMEGILSYVPAHWDLDLDYYPDGNAMVERLGMGSEKLDSMCYFCRALFCLADMAGALHLVGEQRTHQDLANALRDALNKDWWIGNGIPGREEETRDLYADSLEDDHALRLDGHWTVAVPMETRLAPWDRGIQSLDRIEREWVNQWGMIHTREKEEFVWTLPTGVLAMAEFAYGRPRVATQMLRGIAETLKHGTLGSYKELIPEGLSFFQLWSPAMFLQGAVEGLFGLDARADEDRVTVFPRLPEDWKHASVEGLKIGDREIGIFVDRISRLGSTSVRVDYQAGHGRLKGTLILPEEGSAPPSAPPKDEQFLTKNGPVPQEVGPSLQKDGQTPSSKAQEMRPEMRPEMPPSSLRWKGKTRFPSERVELKNEFGEQTGQRVLRIDFELDPGQKIKAVRRHGEVVMEALQGAGSRG